MKKLIFLTLSVFILFGCAKIHYQKVRIKNVAVYAEVADTQERRALGLMHRKELPLDKGMLFVFEKDGTHGFWMKDTNFPLDIIWINSLKKIVGIKADAQPCLKDCPSMAPTASSRYVLEVNAGFAKRNKIEIGDRVYF